MEGTEVVVPLIIAEKLRPDSAVHFLAKTGDDFLPKCRFRVVGGEHFLFVYDEMFSRTFWLYAKPNKTQQINEIIRNKPMIKNLKG